MSLGLVAIDMDETLLRKNKSYDSERFNSIVNQLAEKGIIVCIASGNALPTLHRYIADKTQKVVYLAADNGNVIAKKDDLLEVNPFSLEALEKVEESELITEDFEVVVSTGMNQYSKGISDKNKEYVSLFYEKITYVDTFNPLPNNEEPVKVDLLTPYDLDTNKQLVKKIDKSLSGVIGVTSGGGWVDIYHEDGGKGYAVDYLQKKYNIPKEQTMTFGDSLNDASMMEYAKYSMAMENSDNELKALCNYEIGNNEDQAVLDVLEKYLEDDNLDFLEE